MAQATDDQILQSRSPLDSDFFRTQEQLVS
jgi:hypothetical protein